MSLSSLKLHNAMWPGLVGKGDDDGQEPPISLERMLETSNYKKSKPAVYTVISGSGSAWFYEPSTRKMIKTGRGSEIVVIPGEPDEQGRLLVRTMNTFLLIPADDVLSLGYN